MFSGRICTCRESCVGVMHELRRKRELHGAGLWMAVACSQALMGLVAEAFPRRPLAEVEARVGELLCTPAFNLYARRHANHSTCILRCTML